MGAGKWYAEHGWFLRGARRVVILPDNDVIGRQHADQVGRTLEGVPRLERFLLELPDLPDHGDVVDWAAVEGNTREQFLQLAEQSRPWTAYGPPPEDTRPAIEAIEIRPGMVDTYKVSVGGGIVVVGAEQLGYFPWFNRACIAHLGRSFDPPRSAQAWNRQVDTALRAATRIERPGETLHIHGTNSWATEEVEWTVYDRIPRNGVGLLSAVYGMFKTYVMMDLCGSVMAALPYLGKQIKRRCGVLLFAAEGASTVPLRLRALIEHRLAKEVPRRDLLEPGALDLEHLPFAFFGDCRPLLDPRTVEWMVGIARQAQEHFRAAHGIDLGIMAIDTMSAAAGWDSENDAAQAQIVMNHLADVSRETDTFVLAVDHFGQDVSKGSRGSTAKEAAADTIFYLRGKEVGDGEFTDTRLVLRKQRGGMQNLLFPFEARVVNMGKNRFGEPITQRIIDWNVERPAQQREKSPAQVTLESVMATALDQHGEVIKANGAEGVRAVRRDKVLFAFKVAYQAEHPKASGDAVGQAWRRALDQAGKEKAVAGGVVGGVAYLWQLAPPF